MQLVIIRQGSAELINTRITISNQKLSQARAENIM